MHSYKEKVHIRHASFTTTNTLSQFSDLLKLQKKPQKTDICLRACQSLCCHTAIYLQAPSVRVSWCFPITSQYICEKWWGQRMDAKLEQIFCCYKHFNKETQDVWLSPEYTVSSYPKQQAVNSKTMPLLDSQAMFIILEAERIEEGA